VFAHDGAEVIVGVALMQKDGLADPCGQLQLQMKRPPLLIAGREVTKVVQATFTHGDHFCLARQGFQIRQHRRGQIRGVMRMHTGRGKQVLAVRPREARRLVAPGGARARDDHLHDPGGAGTGDDRVAVRVKAVVAEIHTDINQLHRITNETGRPIARHGDSGTMALMSDLAHSLLASAALGLLAAGLGAQPAAAADTDWRDVESRIQYAWYTEDARDLATVAAHVTGLSSADPLRNYYLALTQLHVAQLAPAATAVGQAAGACISSADEALAARPTDAELLALQSLCMELRSQARSLDVPFAGSRGRAQMQRALQLAPRNPRVRLLAAQLSYASARSNPERAELLGTFQNAVDAFEQERQGLERVPAWGAAEAWQGLAQIYLDRGDAIAARAALEHALLLVPEYTSAHRLLNHILTG
jgi:hypothetical protein